MVPLEYEITEKSPMLRQSRIVEKGTIPDGGSITIEGSVDLLGKGEGGRVTFRDPVHVDPPKEVVRELISEQRIELRLPNNISVSIKGSF